MDVTLFSLCDKESQTVESGIKYIFDCVKNFFSNCVGFSEFTSQKRMLLAISQSLRAADIVIVAVQGNMYNSTKRLLCSALDIKLEKNARIAAKLDAYLQAGKMKKGAFDGNCSFPAGCEILPTNSYINCGFAITSGGQHIIYLPVESPRADEVVFGSMYDYFATLVDSYISDDAMRARHTEIIDRTMQGLAKNQIKVAFANVNGTDFIRSHVTSIKNFNSGFIFENEYNICDKNVVKKFSAEVSQQVRVNNHAFLGALITDAYKDKKGNTYSVIAIAEESGTRCIKVYAENNETEQELLAICVDKLMLLLYDYLEKNTKSDNAFIDTPEINSTRKIAAIITGGAVALSSLIGLVIAFIMK